MQPRHAILNHNLLTRIYKLYYPHIVFVSALFFVCSMGWCRQTQDKGNTKIRFCNLKICFCISGFLRFSELDNLLLYFKFCQVPITCIFLPIDAVFTSFVIADRKTFFLLCKTVVCRMEYLSAHKVHPPLCFPKDVYRWCCLLR